MWNKLRQARASQGCRPLDFHISTGGDAVQNLLKGYQTVQYNGYLVARKQYDRETPPRQILLVSQVLISSDEHVELGLGESQQVAIGLALPPLDLHCADIEMGKSMLHHQRRALVQQNLQF